MNLNKLHQDNKILFLQRTALLVISLLLLVINLCLAIFVFTQTERTIIVPATLAREVVVEDGIFSAEYLEEMTLFFSDLLLNLTSNNIAYKSSIVLKYAHPSHYQALQDHFKQEGLRYKQYNLATQFSLNSIKINKMKAEVNGVMRSHFGIATESDHKIAFEIEYAYSSGGLQIKAFKVKEGDHV